MIFIAEYIRCNQVQKAVTMQVIIDPYLDTADESLVR